MSRNHIAFPAKPSCYVVYTTSRSRHFHFLMKRYAPKGNVLTLKYDISVMKQICLLKKAENVRFTAFPVTEALFPRGSLCKSEVHADGH